MRDFKGLKIWKVGFDIAVNCHKISSKLPYFERSTLGAQIIKSAFSISSNIAEGSGRNSTKEYLRYIEIATGSAFELESQLLVAKEISTALSILIDETLNLLKEEQKMLHGFTLALKTSSL